MKSTVLIVALAASVLAASQAFGHSLILSENRTVGDYSVQFEVAADGDPLIPNFPASYMFTLLDKAGKPARHELSDIVFLQGDNIIAGVQFPDPALFRGAGAVTVSMPVAGHYRAIAHFYFKGSIEPLTAEFPFEVVAIERPPPPLLARAGVRIAIGGAAVFLLAFLLGWLVGRLKRRVRPSSADASA